MGKSITPKYRIEYTDQAGNHVQCWKGQATSKRLEDWREHLNQSFEIGRVNGHISKGRGYLVHISSARIIEQRTETIKCEVIAPLFEVVS